jgi:hypothetical protein
MQDQGSQRVGNWIAMRSAQLSVVACGNYFHSGYNPVFDGLDEKVNRVTTDHGNPG